MKFAITFPLFCCQTLALMHNNAQFAVDRRTAQSKHSTITKVVEMSSSVRGEQLVTSEMMRHEIDDMKRQALDRFEKLSVQIEELKEQKRKELTLQEIDDNDYLITTSNKIVRLDSNDEISLDNLEAEMTRQQKDLEDVEERLRKDDIIKYRSFVGQSVDPKSELTMMSSPEIVQLLHQEAQRRDQSIDLIEGTRWKIMFNIGREAGTWMDPAWGISGDRVLFQVEVDFTSEPLYERDDFFQGISGTKKLDVVNTFLVPRGVGSRSVGRRPVSCKPTGGYKVCRGQGPMGTDLVRLYIDVTENVRIPDHVSDVYCPEGRVYATCGYFVLHNSREGVKSAKQLAQEDHRFALQHQDRIQQLIDADSRLFSVEKLKLMKELFIAKNHVDETAKQLQIARQRDPDKSHLRLSKRGDVGLSKDGGVCCKVQKGMALEYHILGRMEVGCVDDHKASVHTESKQ